MAVSANDATRRGWLSTAEASRLLGVHPDTLRRWADDGRIPVFVTPGKHRRFDAEAIRRIAPTRRAPIERIVRDYSAAVDDADRARVLLLAERHGALMAREAAWLGRSLGEAVSEVLLSRKRAMAQVVDERGIANVDELVDRVLVGMASRSLLARR